MLWVVYSFSWWECKLVQPLWRTVWRFLKKLQIELSFTFVVSFLPRFNDLFGFLNTSHAQFSPIKRIAFHETSCLILLFSQPLDLSSGRSHTSVSSKDDFLPSGSWEVVIKCRLRALITVGHFCVTPHSANLKMNVNYQQPLSKECR